MRIYNNMMVNFQRRLGNTQMDPMKKNPVNKAQENAVNQQNEKTGDSFKSPTERLLSRYFDIEA